MPKVVDHEVRRQQLGDAMLAILRRDGYDAVSLRRVAAEAGVSMGTVQHYFSTKDRMFLYVLEQVALAISVRVREKIAALPAPYDPRAGTRIVLLERLPLDEIRQVEAYAIAAWTGRVASQPDLGRYLAAGSARITEDRLADDIRLAQSRGNIAADIDPRRAAQTLVAVSNGLIGEMVVGGMPVADAVAIVEYQLDLIYRNE